MDELQFAEETLIIAEQMDKLSGNREVINRFIASRLYYAAHHLGRAMLKKFGEDPDSWAGAIHRRVIDELEVCLVNTGRLSRRGLQHLKTLRTKRVKADYLLNLQFQSQEKDKIFRVFREFLNEAQTLLPTL